MPKSLQIIHRTQTRQPQHQTTRLTSRYRVTTLRIVLQGDCTPQEQLPLPADANTDLLTPYLRVMSLMTLGTICLIHMTIHTCTTYCRCLHYVHGKTTHEELLNNSNFDSKIQQTCDLEMHRTPDPGTISHMEGAPAANKCFMPEPTVKYSAGTHYNRLIERRCAS